jgi:hypothetical protein
VYSHFLQFSPFTQPLGLQYPPAGYDSLPFQPQNAMMTTPRRTVAFLLLSTSLLLVVPVQAADFRVDNSVFVEGQSQPQSRGVTIFCDGLVYDFLTEPAEVIVFDKPHRRFLVLDLTRHVQCQLNIDDVKGFVDRVKQKLAGHNSPKTRWLAAPTFDESFDRENSRLTLSNPTLTYDVQLQATGTEIAVQYREFSDWYAQFNFVLNPAARPPFPRMILNEAIERNKGVAKEVHLSTNLGASGSTMKVTSRHELATQLDSTDQNRVSETREFMQNFQRVSFREYRERK